MESGYGAASMDAVAARAGVSKATIYVHFQSKRALFEAIIRRKAEKVFGSLEFTPSGGDVRQTLFEMAKNFLRLTLSPDACAMHRAVMAEAAQQPDVGEAFYQAGPAYARRQIGEYFIALGKSGRLKLDPEDAPLLADLFLSMLAGDCHWRALLGQTIDEERIGRISAMAVDLVMARCG